MPSRVRKVYSAELSENSASTTNHPYMGWGWLISPWPEICLYAILDSIMLCQTVFLTCVHFEDPIFTRITISLQQRYSPASVQQRMFVSKHKESSPSKCCKHNIPPNDFRLELPSCITVGWNFKLPTYSSKRNYWISKRYDEDCHAAVERNQVANLATLRLTLHGTWIPRIEEG